MFEHVLHRLSASYRGLDPLGKWDIRLPFRLERRNAWVGSTYEARGHASPPPSTNAAGTLLPQSLLHHRLPDVAGPRKCRTLRNECQGAVRRFDVASR